jgi:hypothetical protein
MLNMIMLISLKPPNQLPKPLEILPPPFKAADSLLTAQMM